jgi:hypothetical protein
MPIRVDQCHSLFHFGFFFSGVPCNIAFIKFLIFLFHGVFWPPRIPFWGTIKLAVTAWLVLPQFRGGEFVYEQFVRPYIINNKVVRTVDDDEYFSDNQRKLLFSLSPETQSLVAQFIYENGEDAFHSFLAVVNPQMQQDLSPEKSDYIVKERKRDVLKRKMSRLVGLHDRQGQF